MMPDYHKVESKPFIKFLLELGAPEIIKNKVPFKKGAPDIISFI